MKGFLMAASVSRVKAERVPGAERRTVTDVTFDNSYASGGEEVTAANLGLKKVDIAFCNVKNGSESEELPVASAWYDEEKSLLHLLNGKTSKEMTAEKDMSKVIVRVIALGY